LGSSGLGIGRWALGVGRSILGQVVCIGWLVALASALCGAASAADTNAFLSDCKELTQHPHRLAGTEEGQAASKYIEKRLNEIGMDQVIVQPFRTAQTSVKRCEMLIAGGDTTNALALLPMRPCGIIPPVTPPGGVTGQLCYIGKGTPEEMAAKPLRGTIAVMDYGCGNAWLKVLRLGAKAVVFVRKEDTTSSHAHSVEANANLLRFFYDGPAADLQDGARATIHSEVVWESNVGHNVAGFLKGTDPVFSHEKDEVIILAANTDSFGEVPRRSPGARGAANCSALLQLAAHFKVNRPRRHVLLLFCDNQARGHEGSRMFYRALETSSKYSPKKRKEYVNGETEFLDEALACLERSDCFTENTDSRRYLVHALAKKASIHAYDVGDEMYRLRMERLAYQQEASEKGDMASAHKARVLEIEELLADKWKPEKDQWNEVRRALGKMKRYKTRDETVALGAGEKDKFQLILGEVRQDVDARLIELDVEARGVTADLELSDLLGKCWIALHSSLMLGDTSSAWGLVVGGESDFHSAEDSPGLYGRIQAVFVRAHEWLASSGKVPRHFLLESADQSLSQTRVLSPAPVLTHSGEIAGLFGIYNIGIATCQERMAREGTPDDQLDRINAARILPQVDEIGLMLSTVADLDAELPEQQQEMEVIGGPKSVADQEALSLRRGIVASKHYNFPTFSNGRAAGPVVMGVLPGSAMPNHRTPGAVVQHRLKEVKSLTFNHRRAYAFDNFAVIRTDRNGSYSLGPVSARGWQQRNLQRGFAAAFDERGAVTSASDMESLKNGKPWSRLNMFRCVAGALVLPPQSSTVRMPNQQVQLLSARANAPINPKKHFIQACDGVVSWFWDEREKGVKLFYLSQLVGLNNGSETLVAKGDEQRPDGRGFAPGSDWSNINTTHRSATDLWRLNDSRLNLLRSKEIRDKALSELHGRCEDLLIDAANESSALRSESLAACSFLASQPVYRKTRATLDDLVFAVLLLLGLSVPFAFAIERVVIGSATVYRQIGWFAAIFCSTFLALFLTHPAFAVANTPVIIFLGFAIVVMSALVIFIIMRKFEVELRALQGMTTTSHASDVSRITTFMAAMHMGISTMRRRPLRTALTGVTITLLTFTILCFASFSTQLGIVKLFSAPKPPYSGVYIHKVNWNPISDDFLTVFRTRWGKDLQAFPRYWISPQSEENPGLLVTREDGSRPLMIRGALGLVAGELELRPDMKELIDAGLEDTVLMTEAMAAALDVKPGDRVLAVGRLLKVGKLLDAVRLSVATDMDNSSILPVDFAEAAAGQQETKSDSGGGEDLLAERSWASLPPDSVAIVSSETAKAMGAELYGITLYTSDEAEAVAIAEDVARTLPLPVAATRRKGVYRHVLGTVLAASGVADLFFPIVLGGLVIFGTMLASVADREREIYTFSALGLAPRHVATLFFAEAMVYSLIGGMGGYLFAQASLKILLAMAEQGWVRVPEMNMSSTNTIVTILIVMATVLISAIYPGIKASKSANPGLLRGWRAPDPKGDLLELVFPFTVSEYDITGVVSFIREHFSNHADTGLGRFMARDPHLVKDAKGFLGLDADVALAPFDLGVSQSFSLRSTPSEIEGIDEVKLILQRKSGQPKDWRRLNKVFLDDLRQQFLLWRSLPQETMEEYRQQSLTEFGASKESS